MSPFKLFTLAFALILPLSLLGCPSKNNQPSATTPAANSPATKTTTDFDGDRAFEHVRKQVEFGPRPAGSAELEKTRGYIIDQLKSYGLFGETYFQFSPKWKLTSPFPAVKDMAPGRNRRRRCYILTAMHRRSTSNWRPLSV